MAVSFKLYIDIDDDGTFSEEYTEYVHSAEWRLGFSDDLQNVAPLPTAIIVLDNKSSLVAADLYNHQVRITSVDSVPTTRTHWTGWARDISLSKDFTELIMSCVGLDHPLYSQRVSIAIQTDIAAGALIALVLDKINFRLKILKDVVILDDAVQGVLGNNLAGVGITTDLDTGINNYGYAGDRWDNALAIDIIKDIVGSDGGRFYSNRDCDLVFVDRDFLIRGIGVSVDNSSLVDSQLVMGARRINAAQISFAGRAVGAADSNLFELAEPLLIRSGRERVLRCRFRDSSGNAVGATVVNGLVPGVGYVANIDGTTTSDTHTDLISVDLVSNDGNSSTFTISHALSYDLWLGSLVITGTPLARSDPMMLEINDGVRSTLDGINYYSLNAPLVASSAVAEDLANFELARVSAVEDTYMMLWADSSLSAAVLGATVLATVQVTASRLVGVFGESYSVSRGSEVIELVTGYSFEMFGVLPYTLDLVAGVARSMLG